MFDDLSIDELKALRVSLRTAWTDLLAGKGESSIRYGDFAQTFHATTPDACEKALAQVAAAITRRCGGGGPLVAVTR